MTPLGRDPVRGVVADDDSLVRKVVRAALEDHGLTVVEAASREEAIATAASVDFAVIDGRMPGLGLADTVAGMRAGRWIPIVVISGAQPSEELPADVSFLAKPFDLAVLLNTVDRLITSGVGQAEG